MEGHNESDAVYQVVVNPEEQYSIWPADQVPPHGWQGVGFTGPKRECLARVRAIWTDMRPRSLRGEPAKKGGAS